MFERTCGFSTPPCSPVTPLDFLLWRWIKENVHATEAQSRYDLTNRILVGATTIRGQPRQMIRVRDPLRHRSEACAQAGGGNFK
jgi:hypothetical protein